MRKKTNIAVRMLKTTSTVLRQNEDKWKTIPILAQTVPSYFKILEKVDNALMESEKDATISSIEKGNLRDNLEEEVFLVSNGLRSIGNFEKNTALIQLTSFTEFSLSRMPDEMFILTVQKVVAESKKYTTKLSDYGIDNADIAKVEEMVQQLSAIQTKPRSEIVERKVAKEVLATIVDDAKELLTSQIDLQIEVLRRREPEFYSAYHSARQIIKVGTHHEKKDDAKPEDQNSTNTTK